MGGAAELVDVEEAVVRIAVTTPRGQVGSRVLQLLVQAGERPLVLDHRPGRLPAAVRDRCDVVDVDLADGDAVVGAAPGVDTLLWVCPHTGADDPVEGYARLGAVAARAVCEAGVHRVVLLSSVGAEARGGFGEIDGLGRAEALLDDTGCDVTHLRCGYFFSNLLLDLESVRAGVLTTTLPVTQRFAWVDPRDIGDVAAARLLSTAWRGRCTQGVHGPRDLSFAEVAGVLAEVTGRPVVAEQVTDDDVAAGLRAAGLTPAQIDGVVGMSRGMRAGPEPEDPRSPTTTTPTSLGSWAHEHLRPALAGAC